MKLVFDPRKDFAAAPSLVRALYLTLLAMGVAYLASTIAAAVAGNPWLLLAGVPVSYLVTDSGLAVLRGRTVGMFMTRFFSLLAVTGAALTLSATVNGSMSASDALMVATGVLAVVVMVMSFIPGVKSFVKVNIATRQALAEQAEKRRNIEAQQKVTPGSWADISRKD